ncbi:MAG TPA: hypothetical protein VNJ70_00915 [Thermoanaerobaculia bacterium]|nr:hypothetical protein [Thermoanaerobaculia bacterium]
MDRQNSETGEQQGGQRSSPLEQIERPPEVGHAYGATKRRKQGYWKDRGFSRVLEVIIALAAIAAATVAYYQWGAMQATNALTLKAIRAAEEANKIARDTLTFSERQAKNAERQAGIDRVEAAKLAETARAESVRQFETTLAQRAQETTATLEAMRESNKLTLRGIEESRRQSEASLTQSRADTEATLKAMQESKNIAEMAFRHEARARIVAEKFTSYGGPFVHYNGVFHTVTVTLRNIGDSDATVRVGGTLVLAPFITPTYDAVKIGQGQLADPLYPDCDGLLSPLPQSITKGGTAEVILATMQGVEPPQVKAFEKMDLVANAVGCVVSHDELGEVQRTYICASINSWYARAHRQRIEGEPKLQEWEWEPCRENNREQPEQQP